MRCASIFSDSFTQVAPPPVERSVEFLLDVDFVADAFALEAERVEREKYGVDRLVVPIASGDLVIPAAEIDWIGADDYYARVHVGAKSHLLRESLASLETRLDPRRFARVHRSAIVQIDRIREVRGDEVVLRDGGRVGVSRRKRAAIEELLRGNGPGVR